MEVLGWINEGGNLCSERPKCEMFELASHISQHFDLIFAKSALLQISSKSLTPVANLFTLSQSHPMAQHNCPSPFAQPICHPFADAVTPTPLHTLPVPLTLGVYTLYPLYGTPLPTHFHPHIAYSSTVSLLTYTATATWRRWWWEHDTTTMCTITCLSSLSHQSTSSSCHDDKATAHVTQWPVVVNMVCSPLVPLSCPLMVTTMCHQCSTLSPTFHAMMHATQW